MTPAGLPHSDTPGSTLGCQLPRAYRRLLRPSSALDAKASTMCPSQLVTHTTNPTHPPPTAAGAPGWWRTHDTLQRTTTKKIRCSRPLSRSQTTTPHHPTTNKPSATAMAGNQPKPQTHPTPQEPTVRTQVRTPREEARGSTGGPRGGPRGGGGV